ncbi:MAG: FprA family A-type flavoprotein [Deltaproteobacteria bacterium]|nr:MAG: FprA family A-type flavoprotein [Deltaproteobacteria bacterium]
MSEQKKYLVAYVSVTGNTKRIAELLAEGIRITGNAVDVKSVTEIKDPKQLEQYDGFLLGSPTYHRDMVQAMKNFLFLLKKAGVEGKPGGAFGTFTHSGDAPKFIYETMEHALKMKVTDLGSLNILEDKVEDHETIRTCHQYARSVVEMG